MLNTHFRRVGGAHAYHRLMQVHGMFANNGEVETILGSDMSQVELLGSGSPSGPSNLFFFGQYPSNYVVGLL